MYTYYDLRISTSEPVFEQMADLAFRCRMAGIRGWVRPIDDGVWGRFAVLSRDDVQLRTIVGNVFESANQLVELRSSNHCEYPPTMDAFLQLPMGKHAKKFINEPFTFIDRIDERRCINGWSIAADPRENGVELEVVIDDEVVGTTFAKQLRIDLLHLGVGDGELGFRFAIPERFLDGQHHDIVVRQVSEGAGSSHCTRRYKFPRQFEVNAPWRDARQPGRLRRLRTAWRDDSGRLRSLRASLSSGYDRAALQQLMAVWDAEPATVFFDAGIVEAHTRCEVPFLTFRERLDNRNLSPDCPKLIRRLNRKTNTKAYCEDHGIRVPRTILVSGNIEEIRAFQFPKRYVIKPAMGSGSCTYLMDDGYDLWSRSYVTESELLEEVERHLGAFPNQQFVVEELLRQRDSDDQTIPLDYKIHVFGGKSRIVQIVDRNVFNSRDGINSQLAWFALDWSSSPFQIRAHQEEATDFVMPGTLPDMLELAEAVGSDCQDYVRVDLYDAEDGIALGEVTINTHDGVGFTQYGERIMSQLWHVSVLASELDFALPWTLPDAKAGGAWRVSR